MAIFNMYTYQFSPKVSVPETGTLLDDYFATEQKDIMSKKNAVFAEALIEFDFTHRNRKLSTQLLFNKNNITAFKVANKKNVVLEKHFVESVETNEPSTIVIVCNEPDVQRIAIEQHREAFTDTDAVAKFIQNSISKRISDNRLNISIRKEYSETEFWDFVKENPNDIQMIRFEFDYPNLPRLKNLIADLIKDTGQSISGDKARVEYQSSQNALILEDTNDNLVNLNRASSESGTPITFRLRGHREHIKTGNTSVIREIDELDISADNADTIKDIFRAVKNE